MKNLIKDNVISFIGDKRKIIIFVIFAWFCGDEVVLADSLGMSVFEYVVLIMGNHYYLIYFLLISYLFFQFDQIWKTSNCVTIRMRSIRNKYLVQLFSNLIQTLIYVGGHFVVAFMIGAARLDLVNRFQVEKVGEYYNDTLSFVYEYQKYFANPLIAWIAMGLYMVFGLSLLGMVLFTINEIKGHKFALIFAGIMIVNVMLGFKLNLHGLAGLFFINKYYIFHHVLFISGPIWCVIHEVIVGLLIWLLFVLLYRKTGNRFTGDTYVRCMLTSTYRISFIFLLGMILLNCISIYLQDRYFFLVDGLLVNLLGYSRDRISLMEVIKHVLFFAIPLFFIGKFLESEYQMFHDQVKIRYKRKSEWNRLMETAIEEYIWIYAILFLILMVIFYFLGSFQKVGEAPYLKEFLPYVEVTSNEIFKIAALSCALKILELIYYKNLLILLINLLKNRVVAYLLTLFGFIISFLFDNPILSYGNSSLYYLCKNMHRYGIVKLSVILLSILIVKNICLRIVMRWRANR